MLWLQIHWPLILTDFQEIFFRTYPLAIDTAGDGLTDYEEVMAGSNPCNDKSVQNGTATVNVTLTVGDPIGSHSERYAMVFGPIEHAADQFGVWSTGTYVLPVGVYEVSIRHRDSLYARPDYNYYAAIGFKSDMKGFSTAITDPEGIQGYHYESDNDYAEGKSVIATIGQEHSEICFDRQRSLWDENTTHRELSTLSACWCEEKQTCQSCNILPDCEWKRKKIGCKDATS